MLPRSSIGSPRFVRAIDFGSIVFLFYSLLRNMFVLLFGAVGSDLFVSSCCLVVLSFFFA